MEPQATLKKRVRVLLVEDHTISRQVALELLRLTGCEAEAAENGERALAMFHPDAYDLVLMDLGLPDIDGVVITQRIREMEHRKPGIPILVVSANVGDEPARDARLFAAGITDWITKPLTLSALSEKLQSLSLHPTINATEH
jgi:two-component system, sensor histidine kinase